MTSAPLTARLRSHPAPARSAKPSRLRSTSEIVLVTGTVLASAAAFGPAWAARGGIVVAVASAIAACVFSWRELAAVERAHARATLRASERHGRQLREEREHNAAVVDTLSERVQAATATVGGQRLTIASLRHEVIALDGDRTHLRLELQQREQVIGSLRSTVRAQDATIAGLADQLRDPEPDQESGSERAAAEVHHMPRRVRSELDLAAPAAQPVDARTWQTASASVLPNYEEDRWLA